MGIRTIESETFVYQGLPTLFFCYAARLLVVVAYFFNQRKGLTDFDWTQVRVLFVAPRYTQYQLGSIRFNDLPMELWKIKRFERDIILFEQVQPPRTSASISGYIPREVAGSDSAGNDQQPNLKEAESVREVIVYQEEDRLSDGSDKICELYQDLKEYILSLDDSITIKATKLYVGFLLNNHNLVDIKLQQKSLVIWLNALFGSIDDPQRILRDVTHIGHHGNGDCEIKITDDSSIGYVKDLIRKHYHKQIDG
ncbi:MAG: DUF5655 domain-containing protein [Clostridia bacterium]